MLFNNLYNVILANVIFNKNHNHVSQGIAVYIENGRSSKNPSRNLDQLFTGSD